VNTYSNQVIPLAKYCGGSQPSGHSSDVFMAQSTAHDPASTAPCTANAPTVTHLSLLPDTRTATRVPDRAAGRTAAFTADPQAAHSGLQGGGATLRHGRPCVPLTSADAFHDR
jgi:hypothetical protein